MFKNFWEKRKMVRKEKRERVEKLEELFEQMRNEEKKRTEIIDRGIELKAREKEKDGETMFGYIPNSLVVETLEREGIAVQQVKSKEISWTIGRREIKKLGYTPLQITRDSDVPFGSDDVLLLKAGIERMALDIGKSPHGNIGVSIFYDSNVSLVHTYGIWWSPHWLQMDPKKIDGILLSVMQSVKMPPIPSLKQH